MSYFISHFHRFRTCLPLVLSSVLGFGLAVVHGQTNPQPPQAGNSASSPAPATSDVPASSPSVPDVSKEALVFDHLSTRIHEESDGTGTRQTTARVRILADAGVKAMAVLNFTYTESNQQIDIGYVRVIKPDGSVVVTPDYNVQDMPSDVTREAPMYSDIHQKHVAVRGLGVGDTLEYQLTLRTLKADVPGQFWFDYTFEANLLLLDEQLELDVPADKRVTVASAKVQPTLTTANGRRIYHWASKNLARPDPDAPPLSIKSWKPDVQVTTFKDWEEVGAWYASLAKDRAIVTPAIQARSDALTKGLASNPDKVRAIFDDVALHIHYIALNFGKGRYQPHLADEVLANEYGDCKDKHTLLSALLKASGIDSWPVLISTSRELDPAAPSPGQFNHVITVVPVDGKLLWMDSTEEVAPPGVLMSSLRDKQALAVPAAKAAYIERTPADLPFEDSTKYEVEGKLSDKGSFTGHFKEIFHGDTELSLRAGFRGVPQSQWKDLLQGMSNATGFGGDVKNPQVSPVELIGQAFEFSYDYTRDKFGEWDSQRISPPLPPVGWELAPGAKEVKPADDIDIGSPGEAIYDARVEMPDGWIAVAPPAVDLKEDWAEYHAKYAFKDGKFTAERRLITRRDKVPLADWEKYLSFRRSIYNDEVAMEPIFHTGTSQGSADGESPASSKSNIQVEIIGAMMQFRSSVLAMTADPPPAGDDLDKIANDAIDATNSVEAKSASVSANDVNSIYWGQALALAWCVRGWTALEKKDMVAAESYLRAAWRLNQDQVSGYLLGRVLEAKHLNVEAAHLYELAHISNSRSVFGGMSQQDADIRNRISEAYQRVTGKELTATSFKNGAYEGSLHEELDKQLEIKQIVHTTKLTGEGFYSLAFQAGKPSKASFLGGDSGFDALAPVIQAHTFSPELPQGSKAQLLREVRVVCTPWAGCDAYLLRPGSVQAPPVKIKAFPMDAGKDSKTIEIQLAPAP